MLCVLVSELKLIDKLDKLRQALSLNVIMSCTR